MGRLSDARKKAKEKKGQPQPPAEAAAAVSLADAILAGEPDLDEALPQGTAGSQAEPAVVPSAIPSAPPSVPPSAPEGQGGKPLLGSSGLAEDILGAEFSPPAQTVTEEPEEPEEMWPDELIDPGAKAKPVLGSSGLAEDVLGAMAGSETRSLAEDVLGVLRDEPLEPPRRVALPSSGLAEDILQMADVRAPREGLAIDEIHAFESFFEEEQTDETLQLVLFQMEGELFALEIDRVQEIIRVPLITRVPHLARHVRGVCNLRGRIVPVLELRLLMHLPTRAIDRDSRVMVLDLAGKQIGVLVDRASEVVHVKVGDVEPPPEEMRLVDKNLVTAVARLDERMLFILDVDRVMSLK